MQNSPAARLERALESLEGLSVGDAFGEGFFLGFEAAQWLLERDELEGMSFDLEGSGPLLNLIDTRRLDFRRDFWRWTDDTALALEIVAELRENEKIVPDSLAQRFSMRYLRAPNRGYGGAMHELLPQLSSGNWQTEAGKLFDGQGSFGNGAAMRAAPIGAYFADDLSLCLENARLSALTTHAHPEGVAGALAVAVAAAYAARLRAENHSIERADFCELILPHLPTSEVKKRIIEARDMDENSTGEQAALFLGSGYAVAAQDTVPFCVFCAGETLEFYEEAQWLTVSGLGDRDTTCAIVGGIVAARTGLAGIPADWRAKREKLGEF